MLFRSIGAGGFEEPNSTTFGTTGPTGLAGSTKVDQIGTTGGGAASNISVMLAYIIVSTAGTISSSWLVSPVSPPDEAGAGAIYNAAAAAGFPRSLISRQAVKRAATW